MTNTNQDNLDRELDAALARYAAVEPRPGLEERVLANLRSAPASEAPGHNWWKWSVVAAVAAVIVVAIAMAWRSGRPSNPSVARHSSTATQPEHQPPTQFVSKGLENNGHSRSLQMRRKRPRSHPPIVAAVAPKLDQFPSPQPLSEQEQILADYVRQFHNQAVQIARITNEEMQRDRMEVIGPPQGAPGSTEHESILSR